MSASKAIADSAAISRVSPVKESNFVGTEKTAKSSVSLGLSDRPRRKRLSLFGPNRLPSLSDVDLVSKLSAGLEMNGIIRSTVFPNRLRDLRRTSGYASLISFHPTAKKITYSRLAKIERGHVFPRTSELKILCKALECDVDDILIDMNSEDFDRESWAKSHIEGSLSRHDAPFEDMLLAAAVRHRRKSLGLSTAGLRDLGLPTATVSRIENAERPFDRWPTKTREAVFRMFGVSSRRQLDRLVLDQASAGDLTQVLHELFSVSSLLSRQVAYFVNLANESSSSLAGRIARCLEIQSLEAKIALQPVASAVSKSSDLTVFEGLSLSDGSLVLKASKDRVSRKSKSDSLAIRVDRKILGPIDPRSIILFETVEKDEIDEDMVVAVLGKKSVRIGSVRKSGRGYRIVQNGGEESFSLSSVNGDLARLVQVTMPN